MTEFAGSRPARSKWMMVRVALAVAGLAGALVGPAVVSAARPSPCAVSDGVTVTGGRNPTVTGTAGDDTIDCSNARKGYTIYGMGTDGSGGGDQIWGGKARDVIWGDQPSAPACAEPWNTIALHGGGGNDEIHGGMCVTSAEGGPGNDLIIAEGGCNFFWGDDGDDTIDGTNSSGDPSFVTACGSADGTAADGGPGNDHIFTLGALGLSARGDGGNDVLDGGNGRDGLEGGEGDDSLNGNGGDDVLTGGPGIDQLNGGDGDDFLIDDSSDADFFIGGGNNTFPGVDTYPAGDVCFDQDGEGTAPDYPDGSGTVGSVSAGQNDSISGCEVLFVGP